MFEPILSTPSIQQSKDVFHNSLFTPLKSISFRQPKKESIQEYQKDQGRMLVCPNSNGNDAMIHSKNIKDKRRYLMTMQMAYSVEDLIDALLNVVYRIYANVGVIKGRRIYQTIGILIQRFLHTYQQSNKFMVLAENRY